MILSQQKRGFVDLMVIKIKSTARMVGAWRGWDTRRRNQLCHRALEYFRKQAIALGRGLPSMGYCKEPDISHDRAGWYLAMDFGQGYKELRFDSRGELGDWLIRVAPHCQHN